jgi:hypothetical protein
MNKKAGLLAILCSGVTLGVYNPGLLLQKRLGKLGTSSEIYVLENIIDQERRKKIPQTKIAFHRNFSTALMGQKMTGDISNTFDPSLVDSLLCKWKEVHITQFCVFSGFWIPVIKKYSQIMKSVNLRVHICHMDAVISTSWSPYKNEIGQYHHVRLFDHGAMKINYSMNIDDHLFIPYKERDNRYVIHGGGWGMGTYKDKVSELESHGLYLDIICYESKDYAHRRDGNRYFLIDPQWNPWDKINGSHCFPPFGEIKESEIIEFKMNPDYPGVYDLIINSKAIISKPGGATLLDSFSSATPLVFLVETFGKYEKKNAELWHTLGFGISYDEWKAHDFSQEILEKLHWNILDYKDKNRIKEIEKELIVAAQNKHNL